MMKLGQHVLLPGSAEYETARLSQVARFDDVRPSAVVGCHAPDDVAHALAMARQHELHVALRGGGHCFAGRSSSTGIVIDMSGISDISLSNGTVTVGAGARLGNVYDALAGHGLTVAAGCGPTVGIAGLTLGGGLGILGRSRGLTSDQLIAARAVLADGRIVDCDEHHREDLFWALRGAGGGQFAAITELVLRTLPAPAATGFHLVWPWSAAADVICAWQTWAPDAPEEIAASLLIRAPADNHRAPSVTISGAVLDDETVARATLNELIRHIGAPPSGENFVPDTYREVKRYLAEYDSSSGERQSVRREPGHSYSKSEFFRRELPSEVVGELLAHMSRGRPSRATRVLDFTPWGGAYNRVPVEATAFAHRAERFLLKHEVIVDPAASETERQGAREWLVRSWELVHPSGSGGVYPNFPDPELDDWEHAYHGANLDRLRLVKATYDPENVFRFHHSICP